MTAGPDRVTVSHELDGWRWEYKSNGRTIAVSSEAYRDRADCLHGLFLVTGLTLDVPRSWRGTNEQGSLNVHTRRVLREQTRKWRGISASVHDWPGNRERRHIARVVERAAELGHAFADGGRSADYNKPWWQCSCGRAGGDASIVNTYRFVGFTLHARQVVEGR